MCLINRSVRTPYTYIIVFQMILDIKTRMSQIDKSFLLEAFQIAPLALGQ
jgi:hypothetical protein